MATMLLSAAGSSLGGAAGGSLLGLGAASLGRAAGGIAGSILDQQILGRGSAPVATGRIDRIRVQRAGEGDPIPRVFGRMRVAGQIIWANRFRERLTEGDGAGKGGGAQGASYSYTISFAVALCEGRVSRIGRLWADANEVSPSDFVHRLHDGSEIQEPDPLIEAIEKEAPAFRGLAYVVFEDVDLTPFGNRIPQFNIEVWREPEVADGTATPRLSELVRAVALSPGSGEFSLDTDKVRRIAGPGRSVFENVNTPSERPDLLVSLDQLAAEAPKAEAISLIVSWFGDDLRCSRCEVKPCAESRDKETSPTEWRAGGVGRQEARLVSSDAAGRPVFGGTPSDGSVIRAIREIVRRGGRVMFYPFVLMDVPAQNTKTNPWTGTAPQPAFPWRGRITLDRAPELADSTDKTAAAAQEVRAFFGNASPGDFNVGLDHVDYVGPAEWGFRRFILHYAHLCALAGGVDSFCIGSEMRGLTHIRSGPSVYPAVTEFRSLAAEVREILGLDVKIGYAADWSEYFGHQPNDGSGDAHFHLDPLWSDDAIDFIGIDNYMPIADWRYAQNHLDEGFGSPYSLQYLKRNIEGGEGFDWYYKSAAAREVQDRSQIVDGAHGEDWLFRPKDIRQWWSNAHHDRPGGVRSLQPTAWTPGSKPIWFTELGCPAVDLGANQPNVFFDPKSSESFLPYFSKGVRDDFMQRRYLQATLSYWEDNANNPAASLYAGRMVETSRSFVWTWDARPWPEFPARLNVWSDGPNHRLGHWITGRLGAASLADVVAEICLRAGVSYVDVSSLHGVVHGYMLEQAASARAALQGLMSAFSFDAIESGETLRFRHRDRQADIGVESGEIHLSSRGECERRFVRTPDGELASAIALTYIDDESGYETGSTEARHVGSTSTRVEVLNAPLVLDAAAAQEIAERHLAESRASREGVQTRLGRKYLAIEIGDVITFLDRADGARYRVDAVEDDLTRSLTLSRIADFAAAPRRIEVSVASIERPLPALPIEGVFLDLPLVGDERAVPVIAAYSHPWTGSAAVYAANGDDEYRLETKIPRPSTVGVLFEDLPSSRPHIWSRGSGAVVRLYGGSLSSRPVSSVLNGANRAAVLTPSGEWEVFQFLSAELLGQDLWRLTGLLRGQAGTEPFIGDPTPSGATFVLIDGNQAEISAPSALRDAPRLLRLGPARKPYGHDSYSTMEIIDHGARLRPYAPVHLRALCEAETGDVSLSWIRRARVGGDNWTDLEPPLGEAREAYRVRIGSFVDVEAVEPRYIWSLASQMAAGAAGPVEILVSQLSDQFGEGPAAKVIYDV